MTGNNKVTQCCFAWANHSIFTSTIQSYLNRCVWPTILASCQTEQQITRSTHFLHVDAEQQRLSPKTNMADTDVERPQHAAFQHPSTSEEHQHVFQFRRVQLPEEHIQSFWVDKIRDPADPGRTALIKLEPSLISAQWRRTATGEQLAAAEAEAGRQSWLGFMRFVDTLRGCPQQAVKVVMVEMKFVGIKCEDRPGIYDLLYLPRTNEIYAADSQDDTVLYAWC